MRIPTPLYRQLYHLRLGLLRWLGQRVGNSHMVTEKYQQTLVEELVEAVREVGRHFPWFPASAGETSDEEVVRRDVSGFLEVYRSRPLMDNEGGSGFHNCFWLFMIARILDPALLVESGVWRGQTSWILSAAVPRASIHSFDLDLRKVSRKAETVEYHEMDWASYTFDEVDPAASLGFFDCHVNHARRIREAYERGFRVLLFDDNPPVHKLASYGAPALPSVQMLTGSPMESGEVVEWVWKGRPMRYIHDSEEEYGARDLIRNHLVLPDVGRGLDGKFSFLTLVELVD